MLSGIMEYEKILQKIGLTANESKVYLTLLKTGSSKAGRISKECGLNRTSTYNSLRSLLDKGLVSYVIIGKIKWFQASPPSNLGVYLKNKAELLEEGMQGLQKMFDSSRTESSVKLFKGNKGVRTVLEDIISTGKENHIFGSEGQLEDRMPYYAVRFIRQINEKGIHVRSLVRKGRKGEVSERCEVRFVPENVESPVVTNIYGDKIALIIWSEPPEAVLIENEMAARAYRSYFELMWKNAEQNEKIKEFT